MLFPSSVKLSFKRGKNYFLDYKVGDHVDHCDDRNQSLF